VAALLSAVFLVLSGRVAQRTTAIDDAMLPEKTLFGFSLLYLFALFAALAVDRLVLT
jgi:protoheme IX farnesyltransferase